MGLSDRATLSPPVSVGLSGGSGADSLEGAASNDILEGGGGADFLYGRAGSDYLSGGAGDDWLDGGEGRDLAEFTGSRTQYAFSQDGGSVVVVGPDGRDRLTAVEAVQFGDGPTQYLSDVLANEPSRGLALHDSVTGQDRTISMGLVGPGSPGYLRWQYLHPDGNSVAIASATPNVFIKGGSGNDAIQAMSGSNVLDGNTGSNFLVGGTGADGGTGTFFTDARGSGAVWNTLVNFHTGDAATLWGFLPGVSTWGWDGVSGASGYTGATLRADVRGTGVEDASITFAGISMEQAQKFEVASGTVGGNPYLYFRNPGV